MMTTKAPDPFAENTNGHTDGHTDVLVAGAAQLKAPVHISPANFRTIRVRLIGTAPLMQARFGAKAQQMMATKMQAGSTAKRGLRQPRDFAQDFIEAQHRSIEGWSGVPAPALRNAAIDACRMAGFPMTKAKMSIFVEPDGFDSVDGTPLVKLDAPEPQRIEMIARNSGPGNEPDIRVRPMWREWAIEVRITFDADQFTADDVINLLARAGQQVGIGEGRPFSKNSAGLGYGLFKVGTVA